MLVAYEHVLARYLLVDALVSELQELQESN